MDLSQLSTEDLLALRDGDLSRVSTDGLMALRGEGKKPEPMSVGERFGMGLVDPIQGGAQLLTRILPDSVVQAGDALNNWIAAKTGLVAALPKGGVDQQTREREQAYQEAKPQGMDWARLAGNVVSPVNIALGGAAAVPAAASLPARMAIGGAGGMTAASLAPVAGDDYWSEKGQQATIGGVFGAAVPAVAAGAGRLISPKASVNPKVQLLRDAGVRPTIGQSLGGWANRAEEKMQSLPIMGDAIASARSKAVGQLNAAAINRAVAPIGKTVDKIGQEGIKEAGDLLSQAYDDVLSGLKSVKFDQQWRTDLGNLKNMAKALPDGVRGTFRSKVKTLIEDRVSRAGGMTAQTMKQLDSELGEMARRYGRSSVASEQELGDAFLEAQRLLRDQVARNSPAAADALKRINEGWANLIRVEKAGAAAVNNDGVFTPAQLNLAIRGAEQSVRKRGTARGTALMQDLGSAGSMLGNRVPNSGTVDRLLLGGAGLGAGMYDPLIPAGLLTGAGMYSAPMQSLLRFAVTTPRPASAQRITGLLNETSPMFAPAGGLLGLEVLE